ncbi:peptidase S8/S53 domain-containing protein [Dactylonectria estremocensis]|uniref:Peptidase S8/S53 domain-containing protein n=1 Tax=Dactylonectria estremocensis TaxID=1079267 RepID=A0A9P9E0M0_9HYPO|nr:peptidase S8/S53 domain-containing protein [Dactylonectria estremocensis]
MWQLRLLSQIIPAFGALARHLIESDEEDARLCQDANDCYSDLVSIGLALSVSRGEWTAGIDDRDLTKLLQALESRIPTRRSPFGFLTLKTIQAEQHPRLEHLSRCIESKGLGGLDECSALLDQSSKHQQQYLALLGSDVHLFHTKERQNDDKRCKFLVRVKRVAAHLLDVYCRDPHSGRDIEGLSLSQHPSHGMNEMVERVYELLEQHWRCECTRRAMRSTGSRQARLSLIHYHQLAHQIASKAIAQQTHLSVKFEILLPLGRLTACQVADNDTRSQPEDALHMFRKPVHQDIYFLAANEGLWHLKPELLDGVNHHTSMESLYQLLGDDSRTSQISKYTWRDQFLLCYSLANSMLYLYPGSWLQTAWSSNMVYFVRQINDSTSTLLTFPYLAVDIRQQHRVPESLEHMQYHAHPVILALGIMFLEIATGVRFKRTPGLTSCEQWNTDGPEAFQLLKNLERGGRHNHSKRIPTALRDAIRACLIWKPPSDFLSKSLLEKETRDLLQRRVLIQDRKASALKWFQWHSEALARVDTLRDARLCNNQRIKIAILDSGIELSQDNKDIYDNGSQIKYQSWVDENPAWKDQVGHGTHLATLLRRIAPNSQLHVARVFKKKLSMEKSARCISEAIRHAVDEWNVDIIVMSFGFEDEQNPLSDSVNYAAQNNVLMFAAASNDGKNRPEEVAWPARDIHVICVHSAEGYGTPSTFTPSPQDNQRIMVLGECVISAWPQHLASPKNHKLMSGTSCAAPIAAGIAAILLDYARGFLGNDEWKRFRRVDPMRRMFEKMRGPGSPSGYWWIRHWKLFDERQSEGWIQGEIRGALYGI